MQLVTSVFYTDAFQQGLSKTSADANGICSGSHKIKVEPATRSVVATPVI